MKMLVPCFKNENDDGRFSCCGGGEVSLITNFISSRLECCVLLLSFTLPFYAFMLDYIK